MAVARKSKSKAKTRSEHAASNLTNQLSVSILLSNEGGTYIAQCLEWDMTAQAPSPIKALEAFETIFWTRISRDLEKNRPIFGNLHRAPDYLWRQFRAGMVFRDAYPLKPPASIRVPRAQAREIRLVAA